MTMNFWKIPEACIEGTKAAKEAFLKTFSAKMNSGQNQSSFPNRGNKHHQTNIQNGFTGEISENELIKKVLYYLSIPVSEAARFHSLESCIIQIQKQRQQDGEESVFNFMKSKYSALVQTVSENLTKGNKAISLHTLQYIEENLVTDRKNLLG